MLSRRRLGTSCLLLALVVIGTACPAETEPPEGDGSAESGEATVGSEGTSSGDGNTSSPSDTSGGEGSSTDAHGSSGGAPEPACDCVEGSEDFVDLVCDVEEPCEVVEVACAIEPLTDCELTDLTVVEPSVLECYHDALVAGTPGMLRWELPYGLDPGVMGQRTLLIVTEGRQAITWHESWGAPVYEFSDVAVVELRTPEHFDGCMGLGSAEEQFRCLFDATEEVAGVCVPAHEFPIG